MTWTSLLALAPLALLVATAGCGCQTGNEEPEEGGAPPAAGGAGEGGQLAQGGAPPADGGGGESAGGGGSGGGEPGVPRVDCGDASGLSPSAPWAMDAFCPTRHGRSPFLAPVEPKLVGSVWVEGWAWSPAVAEDGALFIGASGAQQLGGLYGFDGEGVASFRRADFGSIVSQPAIAADGTVIIGTYDGWLFAVDPLDGSVEWSVYLEGPVWSSPVIAGDGSIYIIAGHILHAIGSGGEQQWDRAVGQAQGAAIGLDGNIYLGAREACRSIAPDGSERWSVVLSSTARSPSIAADGTVYIANDEALHAITSDGELLWSYSFATAFGQAIAADGAIVVAGPEGVDAVSPGGDQLWHHEVAASSAPTIDGEGTVLVAARSDVHAIAADGSKRWHYTSGSSAVILASIAIGSDRRVYAADEYGQVSVLGDPVDVEDPSEHGDLPSDD